MKNGDKNSVKVFRAIKAEKLNLMTAKNAKTYDDAAELKMLQKMIKEREIDAQCFWAADRDDLASELEDELNVLRSLVPEPPSREEIDVWVAELVPSLDGEVKMGDLIKMTKTQFPTANGKLVSEIVKKYI